MCAIWRTDLIARLKRRAARHGRSTEAEHREILRQALVNEAEPSFEKLAADLRKLMEEFPFDPMTIVTLGPGEEKTQS